MQAMGCGAGPYVLFGGVIYNALRVPYIEFCSHSLERGHFTFKDGEK